MSISIKTINEGSADSINISFFDDAGSPAGPVSLQYRIDCDTTGTSIRQWTLVNNPGSEYKLQLTSADTAIVNDSNQTEQRRITVSIVDGINDEAIYVVKNLRHIPVV